MTTDTPAPASLDPIEKARLVRLERTVDRAVEVAGKIAGDALATIRDEKLYRLTHTTFESYVEERWGFSKRTAYRMIEAATPPAPREVEGSCHRGTNPQPIFAPTSPFAEPDDAEPMPPEAGRLWAIVNGGLSGSLVLAVDEGTAEVPEIGTRVLVAWER